MTTLTLTHLRFDCTATTSIKFPPYMVGNALRNGLADVMLKATCPEKYRQPKPTPEHAATCPACYLLAAEVDPGTVVRGYAVIPPLNTLTHYPQHQPFSFGLTLFGDTQQFLPYFILAVEALGCTGVGIGRREGFGRFRLETVTAVDPLTQKTQQILSDASRLVSTPQVHTHWDAVASHIPQALSTVTICFHTPMRLEDSGVLFKQPDFGIFFRRLLFRIDELNRQYAHAERRANQDVIALHQLADTVRLVESDIHWHELWTNSQRTNAQTPLSGFTGYAKYAAANWDALLPWLIWGQGTQAGKSIVRGNGVYEIVHSGSYWSWLKTPVITTL